MALDKVIGNYILLLGMGDRVKAEMLAELRISQDYPSLQSVVDCFEQWNFDAVVAEARQEEIPMLQPFFIIQQDDGLALVISIKEDSLVLFKHDGAFKGVLCRDLSSSPDKKVVLFYATSSEASGTKKMPAGIKHSSHKPTLADLKAVALGQNESPSYKMFRPLSVFFSHAAIRMGISANLLTVFWLLAIAGASLSISLGIAWPHRLLAIFLILLHFLLDCADGEVARATNTSSRAGGNLEQLFHWIADELLIVGATIGLFRSTGETSTLLLGLACLTSHCVYNYLYIELESWTWEETGYELLRRFSSTLFYVMPLNLLLFLVACIFNAFQIYLWTWLGVSACFFILLALGYFGSRNTSD
jgi:phosphatidylglycerophosphate synthase